MFELGLFGCLGLRGFSGELVSWPSQSFLTLQLLILVLSGNLLCQLSLPKFLHIGRTELLRLSMHM